MRNPTVGAPSFIRAVAVPASDVAASMTAPLWKTVLIDSLSLVLLVWSIPVAILIVGTPIVMAVALVIGFVRWTLQP